MRSPAPAGGVAAAHGSAKTNVVAQATADDPSLLMPRAADKPAPTPAGGVAAAHETAKTSASAQETSDEPTLLMPRAADKPAPTPAGGVAAAHEAAWPNIAAQVTADEPTEVHIHIGRIEVTAVHEATAKRPKQRAKQESMSLENYLAGRDKT